jgi:hypothetical protein
MAIEFRGIEDFLNEIYDYVKITDSSLIEAIAEYQKKYDLDEEYIVKNLLTPSLYEKLEKEALSLNLIKDEKENHILDGI